MKKTEAFYDKRLAWYFAGFILFYAPAALFQRVLAVLLHTESRQDIHDICFRCGLLGMTGGIKMNMLSMRFIITFVLLASAFWFGPIFCRYFCVTGAITEYLSRIVPVKMKINWQKIIDPTPVKYGILSGFLLTPFLGLSVACAYCNYSLFQRIALGITTFDIGVLSSTNILTLFIWIIVLGVFCKGGRGFCSYMCPVGAAQSLVHSIGSRFSHTYKLVLSHEKCTKCGACTKKCPTGAILRTREGIKYNIHNCITCMQCVNVCPNDALDYGTIKNGTNTIRLYKMNGKEEENEIR